MDEGAKGAAADTSGGPAGAAERARTSGTGAAAAPAAAAAPPLTPLSTFNSAQDSVRRGASRAASAAAAAAAKVFGRTPRWGDTLERTSSYRAWAQRNKRRLGVAVTPFRCCKEGAEGCAGSCVRGMQHCAPMALGDAGLKLHAADACTSCPPRVVCLFACTMAFVVYYFSEKGWVQDAVEVPAGADPDDVDTATLEERRSRRSARAAAQQRSVQQSKSFRAAASTVSTAASESSSAVRSAGEALCERKRVRCFMCGFRQNSVVNDMVNRVLPLIRVQPSDYLFYVHTVENMRETIDTNALVLHNPSLKRVVVSFRGTSSAANLRTDLSCLKAGADNAEGTKGPRIHEGFHEAYYRGGVAFELESMLADIAITEPDTEIYLTGHSLGGALATILAWRLARLALVPESVPIHVLTFGAPRVGDFTFARLFDQLPKVRCWRFVNGHDIVPRLPMINYSHQGHLVWLYHGEAKIYPSGQYAPWHHTCLCLNCDVAAHTVARQNKPPGAFESCVRGAAAFRQAGNTEAGDDDTDEGADVNAGFHGYLYAIYQAQGWPEAKLWGGPSSDEFTGVKDCSRLLDDERAAPAQEPPPRRPGGDDCGCG